MIAKDPAGTNAVIAKALKLAPDDICGMLSGLKLTPFADNALFFGLAGAGDHAQFAHALRHRLHRLAQAGR